MGSGHDLLNHDKSMLLAMKNYVLNKKLFFDQTFDVHDRVTSSRRGKSQSIVVGEGKYLSLRNYEN